MTRLHVDWTPGPDGGSSDVAQIQYEFDYDVRNHVTDLRRRALTLRAHFQELGHGKSKVGYCVNCEITGFFQFTDATPKGNEELLLRQNGFSVLYGALRGIVALTASAFPGGRFLIPNVMPQDVVNEIESRRVKEFHERMPRTSRAASKMHSDA